MKIDFQDYSVLPSIFDEESNKLLVPSDVVVEETLIRTMAEMKNIFINSVGFDDDFPLYYMYNGIYREEHKEVFKKNNIKYEYTCLPSLKINGEFLKAHGHIHGIHPIKKTRHIEAYEILNGEGYFELFRMIDKKLEVLLVKVKKGDYLIIPPDYYHLSINTSNTTFVFGDLITEDANSEYGYLKEKNGAPIFVVENDNKLPEFKFNSAYDEFDIAIQYVCTDTVPWNNPVKKIPLYAHFITNPSSFDFLK